MEFDHYNISNKRAHLDIGSVAIAQQLRRGTPSPPANQDQQDPADKDKEDKGKAVNNMQVSDKAVADLCQRLKSGEIKLQLCALESIDVGTRDSPHVGDLPSLLGGHPSDGAHLSRNDHSESHTNHGSFGGSPRRDLGGKRRTLRRGP